MAKDLPPLASDGVARPLPHVPAGDFSNPPGPEAAQPGARPSAFDPVRSEPLDELTTPTRRVYRNADGSETAVVSLEPTRHRDGGGWRDLDLALVPGPQQSLAPRAAPAAARLAATADGPTTLETAAGPIALRRPGAAPVPAIVDGATATYPRALPGGRDLVLSLVDGLAV